MANIHVEKRRHHSVWPWVVGLLALVLVLWLLFEMMGDDRAEVAPVGATTDSELIEDGTVYTTEDPELTREGMVVTEEPVLTEEPVAIEDGDEL